MQLVGKALEPIGAGQALSKYALLERFLETVQMNAAVPAALKGQGIGRRHGWAHVSPCCCLLP